MTGEQKPGGLDPYGWIYETFAPGAEWCAPPEWWPAKFTRTPPNPKTTRNVIALYTAPAEPAEARIRSLEAELEQYRSAARDHNDIWWKTVIGETHQPSGEGISVKHLHPLTVKPFYDQHKGTAIADIIAGLIFEASITRNRERFLVEHANDRATAAEAKLARAVELVEKAKELDVALLHDGYDSGPGGGNYVYAEAVRTDDLFPLLDQALAALQQEGE